MATRAKFRCNLVDKNTVYLSPVYTGSEENRQFFAATPGGQIILHVVNESALAAFSQEKEYYVDFTEVSNG